MNEKLNEEKMSSEKKLPQEKTLKIWKESLGYVSQKICEWFVQSVLHRR